ncbi:MAG: CsgG/HfaB family protein [Halanaerobiales bacterium]
MLKRNILSIMCCVFLFIGLFTFNITAAEKPLLAVFPFEEGDFSWKGFRGPEILNGITQLVTDKLAEEEAIRVIERTRINDILNEQDFEQSGRINPSTAAKIGRILGVDSVVLGTLTQMDVGDKGGISYGPVKVDGVKAVVVVTGRVVDVNTAEILKSFRGEGDALEASFSLSDIKGLSFGSKSFSSSVLGKSINKAVNQFVKNIVVEPEKLIAAESKIITGKVVMVLNEKIIIDIGSDQNLKDKQLGKLVRSISVADINEPVKITLGEVQVSRLNESSTVLEILTVEDTPEEGDIVEFE